MLRGQQKLWQAASSSGPGPPRRAPERSFGRSSQFPNARELVEHKFPNVARTLPTTAFRFLQQLTNIRAPLALLLQSDRNARDARLAADVRTTSGPSRAEPRCRSGRRWGRRADPPRFEGARTTVRKLSSGSRHLTRRRRGRRAGRRVASKHRPSLSRHSLVPPRYDRAATVEYPTRTGRTPSPKAVFDHRPTPSPVEHASSRRRRHARGHVEPPGGDEPEIERPALEEDGGGRREHEPGAGARPSGVSSTTRRRARRARPPARR